LKTFFLAMVLNPKAMKKAQEELDRVVGKGELPDFSHKDNLPYIDALIKEVLRWSPPLPIALPNKAMKDDVYRGHFIPAGAIVIQNVWAVCRDPKIYPDPETFNPDRFLKDGKINPLVFNPEDRIFGTGRR
jgi:cytochrome P450